MTIIRADYIMTMDEDFTIFQNQAVAFEDKIVAVSKAADLRDRFPDAAYLDAGENSVLIPGLINSHVHLEFSANKTTLEYGDFILWLKSVISHREELLSKCSYECMKEALFSMLKTATTTIGAISSFGADMKACIDSPLNVVYFNEILGSNPAMVDALFDDFKNRLYESQKYQKKDFIPAISIHSPYSTHPILAQKAISIAKDKNMSVSTHFMESEAEREWLDRARGDFDSFFEQFMPKSKPVNEPLSYLRLFKDTKALFTHALFATPKETDLMQSIGYITHCPVSNRLLCNKVLDIKNIEKLTLGTDGLSSNNSLSLWDEMRSALFAHSRSDLFELSKKLLLSATREGAKSLQRDSGEIKEGFDADIALLKLPSKTTKKSLPLQLILHTKEAKGVYIAGVRRL